MHDNPKLKFHVTTTKCMCVVWLREQVKESGS